ncbi:unnamed protein product [Rotaria magnacalcarata]|uniref:PITH domain-containing protein n=5 Tax=Rotaria magnacalcarata TaxID=392030 RepID=A0A816AXF8_9BILA|nr:unnamed protein product [Rotaria magnacalcarata]CAF1602991.1 unnamed protein product [Rotaria magnacalcarata]CAF2051465.1 unnamed protein product [Rotaria magnacalcarata]CAF2120942.1 unnamed protein product [Rotaria magnacalcarata]CAF4132205.1 unnamed protein product [Rotaria magnacalcarata]
MQHSCSRSCQHVDETNVGLWNLHTKIDKYNLQCYNEKHDGSGKEVFRAWDERLDRSKVVESDDDPELLFSIPFNGAVKITGLCVIGENGPSHPNTVKLWSNLPELRFENARGKGHQEISLTYDPSGTLAYQVNPAHFSRVTHLSLYFPSNFGDETTRIYYIGLRGEFLGEVKSKIVIATYESKPQLKDHKVDDFLKGNHEIQ